MPKNSWLAARAAGSHQTMPPRPEQVLSNFPEAVRSSLAAMLQADGFCGVIAAETAQTWCDRGQMTRDRLMLGLVECARLYAQAPISNYPVGIICQGLSGDLYFGANLEFTGQALNCTVHGEQAAIIHAWLHGEKGLSALAVGGTPCGHCRQFMQELVGASELKLITPRQPPQPLPAFLPGAFGAQNLGNSGGLMQPEDHKLSLVNPTDDPLTLAALAMANKSYAPYSKSYAGAAILTSTGQIFGGPYAENAAFNPSLSPLQAALVHPNLSGQSLANIERAMLVEIEGARCGQATAGQAVLDSLANVTLEVAYVRQHLSNERSKSYL